MNALSLYSENSNIGKIASSYLNIPWRLNQNRSSNVAGKDVSIIEMEEKPW